ncbi:MAG: CPCC family cysteine-rich protein [Christensenellales bacterium]
MGICKEKIVFPFKCPVCGKSEFNDVDWLLDEEKDMEVYEIDSSTGEKRPVDPIEAHFVHCEQCGWIYDLKQVLDYDIIGDRNQKSVNDLKIDYNHRIQKNPNYNYDEENSKPISHLCPICGKHTFEDIDSFDVCPICGWIDDGSENTPDDDYSEVNGTSIHEALAAYTEEASSN